MLHLRALALTGKNGNQADAKINQHLLDHAQELSGMPALKIEVIIKALLSEALDNGLLPEEFLIKVDQLALPATINSAFLAALQREDDKLCPLAEDQPISSKSLQDARSELKIFIGDNYLHGSTSLDEYIQGLRKIYPSIRFAELFDDELRDLLTKSLMAKFKAEVPKSRDLITKSDFILNYLFRRVIKGTEQGQLIIDKDCLRSLVEALHALKYRLENLHDLVKGEFREMARIAANIEESRGALRQAIETLNGVDLFYILKERTFDVLFQRFFEQYFETPIRDIRDEKDLPKDDVLVGDTLRLCGVLDHSILPDRAYDPFRQLADLREKKPEAFQRFLRGFFNYDGWQGINITDAQVAALLSAQLEIVAGQETYTRENGLRKKSPDHTAHTTYKLLDAIKGCRDVGELIHYIGYPQDFIQKYPHYQGRLDEEGRTFLNLVSWHALSMFIVLLVHRQENLPHSSDPEETQVEQLDDQIRNCFEMSKIIRKETRFRQRLRLPDKGMNEEAIKKFIHAYQSGTIQAEQAYFVTDQSLLKYALDKPVFCDHGKFTSQFDQGDKIILYKDPNDGHDYLLFPEDEKIMGEAKVKVTDPLGNKTEEIILVYLSDKGRVISQKGSQSRLSSGIRGKQADDIKRTTGIATSIQSGQKIVNFLMGRYGSVAPTKLQDQAGRNVDNNATIGHAARRKSESGDEKFFIASLSAIRPDVQQSDGTVIDDLGNIIDQEGKKVSSRNPVQTKGAKRITFEWRQDRDLFDFFRLNGKHGPLAHKNYTAKREYKILGHLHPSHLHAKKLDGGFNDPAQYEIVYVAIPHGLNGSARTHHTPTPDPEQTPLITCTFEA
jgi:hypothetical protein